MDNEFRNLWVAVLARAAEDALSNTQQLLYNGVPTQVKFDAISNANHFFKGKEKELSSTLESYIKDKITVI